MNAAGWVTKNWFVVCLFSYFFTASPALALLPFPLSANQRGTVTCLEKPSISYDIYLPPGYSVSGTPRPILYTMHPNGGGMVGYFQTVCSSMNIIVVGFSNSRNGISWDEVLREFHIVTRDIRQRVLFDPTAEMVGGFSGGGECSYVFSRFRAQHVAGIFAMAGWLGRTGAYGTIGPEHYFSTDRVLTNLLVARSSGNSDTGAKFYIHPDSNYLATCSAVVKDWYVPGGHSINIPDATKTAALSWILEQRVLAAPEDRTNAQTLFTNWQARIIAGDRESVLRECVSNLMSCPRSWYAYQAQLIFDQLATNSATFRSLNVSGLAQGDFASDLFYYYARGAATNNDRQRYYSSLKALTGVTGTSGDRAGDINALLTRFGYPAPRLQASANQTPGRINLWFCKDTPGLACSVQARSNHVNDVWQNLSVSELDTNAVWSTEFDLQPEATNGFYRLSTTPAPGTSPRWP